MVIARTKLMIEDNLLKTVPISTIHFTGSNPERFYKEIPEILRTTFRVGEHAIQERRFKWIKGDPEKFEAKWEVDKDLDKFSYYYIEVALRGSVSKGHGSADIIFEGYLRTEYPQDTAWEKSIFYEIWRMIWNTFFYYNKRDRYIIDGRRLMAQLADRLKEITRR